MFYSRTLNEVRNNNTTLSSSSCVAEDAACVPTKFCGLAGCTSLVQPYSDRKLIAFSLLSQQVSKSFLPGNLGSWFVSVGMVYCAIVTFARTCSRLIESCAGLPTTFYTGTLNWLCKYPWAIDRTSSLCALMRSTAGGRVSPVSSGVSFFNHLSSAVGGIPS